MTTEQIGSETFCTTHGRRAWLCERHPCALEEPAAIVNTRRPRCRPWVARHERMQMQAARPGAPVLRRRRFPELS